MKCTNYFSAYFSTLKKCANSIMVCAEQLNLDCCFWWFVFVVYVVRLLVWREEEGKGGEGSKGEGRRGEVKNY